MSTTKRTSLTFKIKPIFVKHIFVTHNSPTKTSISHCSNLNYILVLRRFPPLARGGRAFRRFASERFSHLSQAERLLTSFSLCSKLAGWPPSARLQSLTQVSSQAEHRPTSGLTQKDNLKIACAIYFKSQQAAYQVSFRNLRFSIEHRQTSCPTHRRIS